MLFFQTVGIMHIYPNIEKNQHFEGRWFFVYKILLQVDIMRRYIHMLHI